MQSKTTGLFFITGLFLPTAGLFCLLLSACGEGYWSELDVEDPDQRPAVYEEGISLLPSAVPLSNPPAFSTDAPFSAGAGPVPSNDSPPPAKAEGGDQDEPSPPLPAPSLAREDSSDTTEAGGIPEAPPQEGIRSVCVGGPKKVEGRMWTEITYQLSTEGLSEGRLCELDYSATANSPDWWAFKTQNFCEQKMMEKTHGLILEGWNCEIHRGFETCVFLRESNEWICRLAGPVLFPEEPAHAEPT